MPRRTSRPELVDQLGKLQKRFGCSKAELHAAVNALAAVDTAMPRKARGHPKDKVYGRLIWEMLGPIWLHREKPYTLASQLLSAAGQPTHQLANQSRALVRRFKNTFNVQWLRSAGIDLVSGEQNSDEINYYQAKLHPCSNQ